jgi:IS30 family transposase
MRARDVVRQMKADGFTVREIIDLTGKHPVTVYRDLTDYNEKRRERLREKRRARGSRTYECGVCGRRGHNARSHSVVEQTELTLLWLLLALRLWRLD